MLNNNTMGLDKSCMDKPYLIGRATALVEKLVSVPIGFVAMVQVNPLQKLTYPLREALKTGNEELMDIAANIGNIPSPFVDAKAQFYVGYYHQKSEIAKCEDRVRIGKRIAEIRQEKGLSIRQLAEACGVNFANIYKIENGKYNVSVDILGKICEALNCRIDIVEE
jgi:DNA-binding Xre family transcriptional regulator